MNKLFTKLVGVSLGLTMAVGVGFVAIKNGNKNFVEVKAASATITAASLTSWNTTAGAQSGTASGITVATTNGCLGTASGTTTIRNYASATLTITSAVGNITEAVFTCTANGTSNYGPGKMSLADESAGEYTYETQGKTGTWTGNSATFQLYGGQARIVSIEITYTSSGAMTYATGINSISGSSSVSIGNSIQLSTSVTPNNATIKTVSWSSTNVDIPVDSSGKVVAYTEGTTTITASADGAEVANSVKTTKVITSTVDNTYDHCDVITPTLTGISANTSGYTAWSSTKTATNTSHSTAVFNGKTNYASASKGMGFRNDSGDGIIVSTSGGLAKKVVAIWGTDNTNGRTLNIHGSNSALSLGSMGSTTNTIAYATDAVRGDSGNTDLNSGNGYKYLAFNASNTMYVRALVIYWDDIAEANVDLAGDTSAVLGDTVQYTATRSNSSATIDWYVDSTKQNSGITIDGNTSTFSFTPSSAKSYSIKALLNGTEVQATKTLTVVERKVYSLATSASDLYDGVEVILVGSKTVEAVTTNYNATKYVDGNNVGAVAARMSSSNIIGTNSSERYILNITEDGYTFKTFDDKYLSATGGTSNNHLTAIDLNANKSYWTIDFDADCLIVNKNDTENFRGYMQFNQSNSIFACYASASQSPVSIYRLVESDKMTEYAEYFITAGGLGDGGCADTITMWDEVGDEFDNLSAGEKALYAHATHNPSETYTDNTQYTIAHAVARYDDAILKHSELRSNEFMGRFGEGKVNGPLSSAYMPYVNSSTNPATLIVVIVSLTGITTVAAYFFLKRKHQ